MSYYPVNFYYPTYINYPPPPMGMMLNVSPETASTVTWVNMIPTVTPYLSSDNNGGGNGGGGTTSPNAMQQYLPASSDDAIIPTMPLFSPLEMQNLPMPVNHNFNQQQMQHKKSQGCSSNTRRKTKDGKKGNNNNVPPAAPPLSSSSLSSKKQTDNDKGAQLQQQPTENDASANCCSIPTSQCISSPNSSTSHNNNNNVDLNDFPPLCSSYPPLPHHLYSFVATTQATTTIINNNKNTTAVSLAQSVSTSSSSSSPIVLPLSFAKVISEPAPTIKPSSPVDAADDDDNATVVNDDDDNDNTTTNGDVVDNHLNNLVPLQLTTTTTTTEETTTLKEKVVKKHRGKKKSNKKKSKKPKEPAPFDWEAHQRERLGIQNNKNSLELPPSLMSQEEFPDLTIINKQSSSTSAAVAAASNGKILHSENHRKNSKNHKSNQQTSYISLGNNANTLVKRQEKDKEFVMSSLMNSMMLGDAAGGMKAKNKSDKPNAKGNHPNNATTTTPAATTTTAKVTHFRGKEREVPTKKKPNRFKLLILHDRKLRAQVRQSYGRLTTTDNDNYCGYATDPEYSSSQANVGIQGEKKTKLTSSFSSSTDQLETCSLKNEKSSSFLANVEIETLERIKRNVLGHKNCSQPDCKFCLGEHSRKFRDYCDHKLCPNLDEKVRQLLATMLRFQDRMYQKDPLKARIRRRYVVGLREIKKYLGLKKVKCVIFAPDVEPVMLKGGLDDAICQIIHNCQSYQVPYLFSLRRRELGKVLMRKAIVSAVALLDYSGAEVIMKEIFHFVENLRKEYQQEVEAKKFLNVWLWNSGGGALGNGGGGGDPSTPVVVASANGKEDDDDDQEKFSVPAID